MANNVLSNGRLQENTVVQRTRNDRSKRGIVNIININVYVTKAIDQFWNNYACLVDFFI